MTTTKNTTKSAPRQLRAGSKSAQTWALRMAASARGVLLDCHIGTITPAERDRRLADHADGMTSRGLAPLTMDEIRHPQTIKR